MLCIIIYNLISRKSRTTKFAFFKKMSNISIFGFDDDVSFILTSVKMASDYNKSVKFLENLAKML